MLALPKVGFRRSVKTHNVDLVACCDWLEANVLFGDDELSGSDVVDLLKENEIYDEQNFAWELVSDALRTIQQRKQFLGDGYPFEVVNSTRLTRKNAWKNYPAYSFCIALSLAPAYPQWSRSFGADFTTQGSLFEELTAASIKASLTGWDVHTTGWTRQSTEKLKSVVTDVASRLGESAGDITKWSRKMANEAGLDILCYRTFPDQRGGYPVLMFQCASGADWEDKLKTPDLRVWTKIVVFPSDPKKAFALPFALSEDDFKRTCNVVDGLLLDRYRLLAPGHSSNTWLSTNLARKLIKWTKARVGSLPDADAA